MRVARVVPVTLQSPVPVYDIEVPKHSNFLLHGASYVHNSKDVADAVCGAEYGTRSHPSTRFGSRSK